LTRVLRYVIGGPILVGGLLFAATVVMNGWSILVGKDWEMIPGTIAALLFGGILLPLGWWMVMSRSHFRISPDGREVSEIVDWRLGRKVKVKPVEDYRAVRLSVEPLNESTNRPRDSRPATLGIRVALDPRDKRRTPPLELGWFEPTEVRKPEARDLGEDLGRSLDLPVEDELDRWFGNKD
ncbi:MAG: hypothetical protein KDM63_08440, partial [Verrucomicrobiae bacterium]|nr:hypothetical protein [Verrucomicrobiae bacterium]